MDANAIIMEMMPGLWSLATRLQDRRQSLAERQDLVHSAVVHVLRTLRGKVFESRGQTVVYVSKVARSYMKQEVDQMRRGFGYQRFAGHDADTHHASSVGFRMAAKVLPMNGFDVEAPKQQMLDLDDALESLPYSEQRLVRLRFGLGCEEHSARKLSKRLGKNYSNSLRPRLESALSTLKRMLV